MARSIFVCYRRSSDAVAASTVTDFLEQECPSWNVFRDVDKVQPGQVWPQRLQDELERAHTVIVVIGKAWLTSVGTDGYGLNDPQDWVRQEIATALAAQKRVIPLLVDAPMPSKDSLQPEIQGLSRCEPIQVRSAFWKNDLRPLAEIFAERGSAHFALLAGLVLLFWQVPAWVGVQTKRPISLLGIIRAYPSEVIVYSLCVLPFLLIPLHLILHRYLRNRPGAWFPAVGALAHPDRIAVRVAAFFLLVIVPTAVQCFWVGRVFDADHLYMVWKGPRIPKYTGWALLTHVRRPNGSLASPLDSNWAWQYWYDERSIVLEKGWDPDDLTTFQADFARTSVAPSAIPLAMPWWFLGQGIFLLPSSLFLVWRATVSRSGKEGKTSRAELEPQD